MSNREVNQHTPVYQDNPYYPEETEGEPTPHQPAMDYTHQDYTYLNDPEYTTELEYYQQHQISPKNPDVYPQSYIYDTTTQEYILTEGIDQAYQAQFPDEICQEEDINLADLPQKGHNPIKSKPIPDSQNPQGHTLQEEDPAFAFTGQEIAGQITPTDPLNEHDTTSDVLIGQLPESAFGDSPLYIQNYPDPNFDIGQAYYEYDATNGYLVMPEGGEANGEYLVIPEGSLGTEFMVMPDIVDDGQYLVMPDVGQPIEYLVMPEDIGDANGEYAPIFDGENFESESRRRPPSDGPKKRKRARETSAGKERRREKKRLREGKTKEDDGFAKEKRSKKRSKKILEGHIPPPELLTTDPEFL